MRLSCCLCGEQEHRLRARRSDGQDLWACGVCGLTRLVSLQAPAYDQGYFDGSAVHGYSSYVADTLRSLINNPLCAYQIARRQLDRYRPGLQSLAELGCGWGLFNLLLHPGESYQGFDLAADALEAAKRSFGFDNLKVASLEGARLAEPVQALLACDVLEHLSDPLLGLRSLKGNLQPGGLLVLSTPNAGMLDHSPDWSGLHSSFEHLYFFDQRSLGALLKAAGYQRWVFSSYDLAPQSGLKARVRDLLGLIHPRWSTRHQLFVAAWA
jgi:predicted TPR repeat methyltransferase